MRLPDYHRDAILSFQNSDRIGSGIDCEEHPIPIVYPYGGMYFWNAWVKEIGEMYLRKIEYLYLPFILHLVCNTIWMQVYTYLAMRLIVGEQSPAKSGLIQVGPTNVDSVNG